MENQETNKLQEEVKILNDQILTDVPLEVSQQLFKSIQRKEALGTDSILKKVAGIQIVLAVISLLFCHQFGLGYFKYSLASIFMALGPAFGNLLAGVFYGTFSLSIMTLFFLNAVDRQEIRNDKIRYLGVINVFSLIFLGLFGDVTLINAIIWLVGSSVSSNYLFDQADAYIRTKA